MLITVSSSIMLGILLWGFLNSARKYHNFKETYGDMYMYGIPSVKQARRYAELRGLKLRCYIYLVAIILVTALVIGLSFY